MRTIEAAEVHRVLAMPACIELMRTTLADLENGISVQPPRSIHKLPHGELFGFMPAYLGENDYFGAKVVAAFHANVGTEYPSHTGYVMLFESVHGVPVGFVDATSITQIRTGAVSGVATDLLARPDATALALIGAGVQARSHLEAVSVVRAVSRVTVYDVARDRADAFKREMENRLGLPITVCDTVHEAVEEADIICTVTPASTPYLRAEWVKPGAHINAVGAFTPSTRELTSELIARSRLYADYVDSMKRECGEFLVPKAEGLIGDDHIVGSIGEVILGRVQGRQAPEEITVFDALGLAVEDVACARYVCGHAGP